MRAKLFLFIVVFLSAVFVVGILGLGFATLACAQEEEEPIQARPNPLEKSVDKKSGVTSKANAAQRAQREGSAQEKNAKKLSDNPAASTKSKAAMPPDPLGASRAQKAMPPDPYESQKSQAAMPVEPLESTKGVTAAKAQKMNAQKMKNADAMNSKASQVGR